MATLELQSACSPPTHLSFSLIPQLPPPPITSMLAISLLLCAFLISPASSSKPSSHSSLAASTSLLYTVNEHDKLSITLPLPQKEEALLHDDAQNHASKEDTPFPAPAFIYETVAASLSRADGHHQHHNELPQDLETAIVDDGVKNLPSSAQKAYIYESVTASNSHGSMILRKDTPPEESSFPLDDGIGKKDMANPSDIYKSVIAASIPSKQLIPSDGGSILHDNVPQEENAFLHDDDGTNTHIVQKKEDPIIPKPSYIYESVAASVHPEVGDAPIRTDVLQEENGFLIDDGSKHVEDVNDQYAKESEDHDVLHGMNASQEDHFLLDDGGYRKEAQSNKLSKAKDGEINNHKKPAIYHKLHLTRKRSFYDENIRMVAGSQSVTGLDDGRYDEESLKMVDEDEEHLQTDIRIDDPQSGNLRMVVDDSTRNTVSEKDAKNGKSNEKSLRMVVGDSSSKREKKGDRVEGSSPNEESALKMVVGDSPNTMIHSDSMLQQGYGSPSNNLRMVVDDDTSNNILKAGPFSAGRRRGRSPFCTSNVVCQELAHAEHLVHIALYGQLPGPTPKDKNMACCGGICVDLDTDLLNCGACGTPCGLIHTCCQGECIDLNTDSSHCGQCDHNCPSGYPCQFGMCGYY